MQLTINTPGELPKVAQALVNYANGQKFFVFEGEMAAGKTTFIKAFCEALGVSDVVSSPTFSIVNEYESNQGPVYHFDFYRLKNLQEAYDIGYEEYFYSDSYCLIEWPSKVDALLPEEYIKVQITVTDHEQRLFEFSKVVE
ncbi:tRNA (adenosine(37)-N6)-threonylcarbamoyltransferase complex ATPase subunit type 1 TsaE [Pedobacter nanyangensis]|uniref:tRNA (adenosine(37)-N6)-threonylcarbamoyltransferase complex ATPase subunit type 1 TsaE n=1 Tax=Pedobacter nanyangensis TaxID=1562389 RepID=UPI000DE3BA96|nr:tRNA (adenosine(37)-N6)-threonylcarbamoyltransferase complex ATPase subunit type 1 TsaE [Pedobacter nanyangensis]